MALDPRRFDTTVKTSRASYETALANLVRETIRRVAEDMRGEDANRVHAVLVARFAGRLPGAELDQRNLQKIAAAIARGRVRY